MSTSGIETIRPRSARLVTPWPAMPHGTIPAKCSRSGSTLSEMPCRLTQRRRRMPIAAILSSTPGPRSGLTTHTPTRSERVSPFTPNASSVSISQPSSAETKARTSLPRRFTSSIT
jgi:hypothetical protein